MSELLQVKDLHTSFFTDAGEVRAVNGVSFNLDHGKVLGIVGESGSGKSVTAYSIMQILAGTGKIVSGFTWHYVGVCSAGQGQKLLGQNGKPLSSSVQIRFPGQTDRSFKATVSEVTIDEEQGLARFVLTCNVINGDVLCLNHAAARISVGESTGLRIPASAVHYLKEDGTEAETQGENYIPGVYVKYGNIARFCKIDPVDNDHPLVTDGDYILVLPKGTDGSVSQVRLYDEIIVSGQNLYDGKLL